MWFLLCFGHEDSQCQRTYASVTAPRSSEDSDDVLIDEADVQQAASPTSASPAENLSLALARAISARAIRERCNLFLAQFIRDDHANLRKTGTEEQYGGKEQLFQESLELAKGHGYRIRPGAARRAAGCSSASLCQAPLPAAAAGSVVQVWLAAATGSIQRAERRLATAVRDFACAAIREDSANGAATTGVRQPSVCKYDD
ncbi:hypothetical protein HPB51_027710 [Rhipicephalus microplus]|uniref:Uncharacterized protein n=1 Tax=Rhipicephalus microplus TaxID=6941 RepID=A0A9J6CZI6_RHIMP|nr:hypothetical protein HPB51_027710 [Rhipicephalus microplus]